MSKPKNDGETQDPHEGAPVPGLVPLTQGFPGNASARVTTFRDTLYTSRTVILPDGRTLAVAKSKVSVDISDEVALTCLKNHAEFEPLQE
ncbi:hypothetical protein [Pseudomonas sp. 91RF]|uniref:hypothetical protein n=1 Tax=Pseudomonas sp. 91RF TaxID=2292261 RepID=UPI0021156E82|nr:hypothetical protein [Pseudomonas sp. 91RF]